MLPAQETQPKTNPETRQAKWERFAPHATHALDSYIKLLEARLKEALSLSDKARQETLDHVKGLIILRGKLPDFAQNPDAYNIATRRQEEEFEDEYPTMLYIVRYRSPGDPKYLPEDPDNPQNQLNFYVKVNTAPVESRGDRMHSAGLSRPPDEAVDRYNADRANYHIEMRLNTLDLFRNPLLGRAQLTPRGGIAIGANIHDRTSRVMGGIFLGDDEPHTRPLPYEIPVQDLIPVLDDIRVTAQTTH